MASNKPTNTSAPSPRQPAVKARRALMPLPSKTGGAKEPLPGETPLFERTTATPKYSH